MISDYGVAHTDVGVMMRVQVSLQGWRASIVRAGVGARAVRLGFCTILRSFGTGGGRRWGFEGPLL